MKRIIAYIVAFATLLIPVSVLADAPQVTLRPVTELAGTAVGNQTDAAEEEAIQSEFTAQHVDEIVEFTTYAETPEQVSHRNALNIARYEPMLRELARDAFYVGEGWDTISDIPDLWNAMYSYLNRTGIDANSAWVQPDGTALISGADMRKLFLDMYGVSEAPAISSTHAMQFTYDETADAYTVTRADGDNVFVLLTGYALNTDSTAALSFNMIQQYSLEDESVQANLGSVTLHLVAAAGSEYGFLPDALTYYPEG